MQFRRAAARFESMSKSDKWQQRLEQEYEQLKSTLQLWAQHQQAWYETKTTALHEKLTHWERLQMRDSYREARFRLKIQQQRWQQLIRTFPAMHVMPAA